MIPLTPELAEICGIHAGDGYLRMRKQNKGEIDISGHLEEKDYYYNHVIPLFNKVFNLNIKGRYFSRGSYGFVIYNKKVAQLLNELGFPFGNKSKIVEVPKQILESNEKILYTRFLRGLFDTDGCLYFQNRKTGKNYTEFKRKHNYYPIISLTSVSKLLMESIGFMLKELGLKHFAYGHQPKNLRDSYRYVIIISGVKRLQRWMELIGIKNSVKLTRYLVWKKFGFCPPHTSLEQRKDLLKDKLNIYNIGL